MKVVTDTSCRFVVHRFDRAHGARRPMVTADTIFEEDWRTAALDYHTLMKMTKILSINQAVEMNAKTCSKIAEEIRKSTLALEAVYRDMKS